MTQDARLTGQRTGGGVDLRIVTRRALRLLAAAVRLVSFVCAAILVVHVVLTVAGANPVNDITIFFRDAAAQLTLGFSDLFLTANAGVQVLLNFGIPAVIWILIGWIVSKIILALSP